MPIPTPRRDKSGRKTEKKSEFISRCAGDSTMNKDYPDAKQRVAICYQKWEEKKTKAAYVISAADEEYATFIDENPSS